jgi:hypothetical protein
MGPSLLDCWTETETPGNCNIPETKIKLEGQAFLYRIVVIDETWVRGFEREVKSQSNECRSPTSPRPKKFRRAQSKVKQLMIIAYNQGIIMIDRVLHGTCLTAVYYHHWMQTLCRKMHKNWPDLFGDGPLILHNNARPHLGKVVTDLLSKYRWKVLPHAPYSPDMSPPDFDLFSKLKETMCGQRFSSLEEVSAAVTWAIWGLNRSGTLNGIHIFWNAGTRSLRSRGPHRRTVKRYCLK